MDSGVICFVIWIICGVIGCAIRLIMERQRDGFFAISTGGIVEGMIFAVIGGGGWLIISFLMLTDDKERFEI